MRAILVTLLLSLLPTTAFAITVRLPPNLPKCEESKGGFQVPFDASATGTTFYERAKDFTLTTLGGDFELSKRWTGCDSVMVLTFQERLEADLFESGRVAKWLKGSPTNVDYILYSLESDMGAAAERVKAKVEAGMASLTAEQKNHWTSRIHYVSAKDTTWIAALVQYLIETPPNYVFGFNIDRYGYIVPRGNMSNMMSNLSVPEINLLTYEAEYMNFQAAREVELASENEPRVIRVFEKDYTANLDYVDNYSVSKFKEVVLPSAEELRQYERVEVDHEIECQFFPEMRCDKSGQYGCVDWKGGCAEWDSPVRLYLCDKDDPKTKDVDESMTQCETLVMEMITPYARAGRWITDVRHLLGLIADGGTRRFRIFSQQPAVNTVELRFVKKSDPNDKTFALGYVPLWCNDENGDMSFDADYDENRGPMDFTPPKGATKAVFFASIRGGGAAGTKYCAEFCNHEHTFTLNDGEPITKSHPEANDILEGCLKQIGQGTVPTQWGNWARGRANWCPGREIAPHQIDFSEWLEPGVNTLYYSTTVDGKQTGKVPKGASIAMWSYMVFYGTPESVAAAKDDSSEESGCSCTTASSGLSLGAFLALGALALVSRRGLSARRRQQG